MSGFIAGLTVGLLGSVHCVVMCGGIAGALSVAVPPARRTPGTLTLQQLSFSLGRILSYVLAGTAVGAVGSALAAASGPYGVIVLRAVAAVLLVAVGLYLGGWSPAITVLERQGARLWQHIAPLARRLRPGDSPCVAVLLGGIWGWLPCGLVYSALSLAGTSGSALGGATLMLGFGVGTVPAMVGVGVLADQVAVWLRGLWTRRVAGAMVIVFALWTFVASTLMTFHHAAGTDRQAHDGNPPHTAH